MSASDHPTAKTSTATVFLVCGATGAGKTTFSVQLAEQRRAVRFSIDPWMTTLFAPDQKELSFEWAMERVQRCERQMWQVAEQLIALGVDVVLDLGFTTFAQRQHHRERALALGARVAVCFLDRPSELRRQRVAERNQQRDPRVFAFEVTDFMFDFMEPRFEPPSEHELEGGMRVT